MDLAQTLLNATSPDMAVRQPAEERLRMFEEQNLAPFLGQLCAELMNEKMPEHVRQLAGMVLKNALAGKSEAERQRLAARWTNAVPEDARAKIKQMLLAVLRSTAKNIRSTAALVIAKIATIEIPKGQWQDIIPMLVQNITTPANPDALKQSSFEALGYICEECPEPLQDKSSMILTAIATGMGGDQQNNDIKLAATMALVNSLEFVKANFAIKRDRDMIMKMVFEASQCQDARVRISSYQCLVEIASSYYEYLPEYIEHIFKLTTHAMQNESEEVSLQAVEFWSTICDEEIMIQEEVQDALEKQQAVEKKCHQFMKNVLPHFMPLLLMSLAKQTEEVDDDTWNVAMAAGTCMGLIAQCTTDAVVDYVLPFVQSNITNPNWRLREASVLAFGSILDGPSRERLAPLVAQAFPVILHHLKDPNPQVKDTSAWTIGRICSLLPETITEATLEPMMHALVASLKDVPKVASNVCWAIHNLATSMEIEDGDKTSPLSRYFEGLITALLATTDRPDVAEGNLLSSAYEAINVLIHTAAPDMYPLVGQLVPALIEKLKNTLMAQGLTAEDREKQNEVQGLLCGALQVIIQKLEDSVVIPHADTLMLLFLKVLHSKHATIHEEALLAIGAIATRVGGDFEKYMAAFKPSLMLGLQNAQEHHVCIVAVGVVSELSRALNAKMAPYCDEIMQALLCNLQNPMMERSVKPHIISCLADVALAVGGYFERYVPYVMLMLVQASQIKFETMDYDNHEYLNTLRVGVLEAYTGILQGLADHRKEGLFVQFVDAVMGFLDLIASDDDREESVTRAAVGVIGDLGSRLGDKIKTQLNRPSVMALLNSGLQGESESTRTDSQWSKEQISKLMS